MSIELGEYLLMGKYYDEPILWRCVDIDENGPLMLSDRILTIKSFDAKGVHKYLDGTLQAVDQCKEYGSNLWETAQAAMAINYNRTNHGSNLWETSNIRSWLNSTATAGNVTWLDGCPPTKNAVLNGYNAYATEKGFLADGNFTASERNAIQSVTQKSILNGIDVNKLAVGGTATYTYFHNISTVVRNYDTSYYQNVTDMMFLLNVKQINKVYLNSTTLGTNYYIGKPTQKAVDNSEFVDYSQYKDLTPLNPQNNWACWSSTPCADSYTPNYVRIIDTDGCVYSTIANASSLGARPAFYLNLTSVIFKSGNGTVENPFIISTPSGLEPAIENSQITGLEPSIE